jgi:hypothetical protein
MKDERTSLLGSADEGQQQHSAGNDNAARATTTTTNTRRSIRFSIGTNANDDEVDEQEGDDIASNQTNTTTTDFSFVSPSNNNRGRRNTVVSWAGGATAADADGVSPTHRRRTTTHGLFRRSAKSSESIHFPCNPSILCDCDCARY